MVFFGRFLSRACVLFVAASIGCSTPKPPEKNPAEDNLRKIAQGYMMMVTQAGKAPKDFNQLKPYLAKTGSSNPDDLVRSPNDGEPFVIIWNVTAFPQIDPKAAMQPVVLAYEKNGAKGLRCVVFSMGNVETLDEEAFQKASFPAGHKPAP